MSPDRTRRFAKIEAGNHNWTSIFEATQATKADRIVVEQDIYGRDPFESLMMSYEFLRDWGNGMLN